MNTFHFLLRLILVGLVSNIIPEPHAYSSAQITDYSPPSISGPIRQAAGLIHPIAWDVSQIIYNLQPLTNTAPLAVNDTYSVNEDTTLVIPAPGVLANDSDAENDPLTAIQQSATSHGQLTFNLDGSFSYSPTLNFNGLDSFTYIASDVFSTSNTATVIITILAVNDPPVANPDTASTPEDTPVNINVSANDTDVDNNLDPTTVTVTGIPAHGTTSVYTQTGIVAYTPHLNYNGTDSFTYLICDGNNACDNADVAITITAVNDPPQANDDTSSTAEDTPVGIDVVINDADVDGNLDPGSVTVVSGPGNGTTAVNSLTGVVTYTSNLNFNGSDSFTYQICDTGNACDTANVAVTIGAVNDPPSVTPDTATTAEDNAVTIDVLANDSDPEGNLNRNSLAITSPPTNGSTRIHPVQRTVIYTPTLNYNGADSFIYQVCDTFNACSTAGVTITITPVNDPPVAIDDTSSTPEDIPVMINVIANDTDVDGSLNPASVFVTNLPTHGITSVNTLTGAVTYSATLNYNGGDTFGYQVCDNLSACDTAIVTITVTPVNDPPAANNDIASTPEDIPVLIDVLANDFDPDGPLFPNNVSIVSGPVHGTTAVNTSTGAVTYTPSLNYNGGDNFTYQLCDNLTACDTAIVTITVTPVNDPPVANNDSTATPANVARVIDVLANDADPDNNLDPSTVTVLSGGPAHGQTSVNTTTGAVTYSPTLYYNGSDSFTYQVCDTSSACSTAQVTITVGVPNVPPVANPDLASTPEDTAVQIDVTANDNDADGNLDPATVTVLSGPANGATGVNSITGVVTYTSFLNFNGNDIFIYQVCDSLAACDSATVTVTVTAVNDPPVANNDTATTPEDTSALIDVLNNDSDPDSPLVPGSMTVSNSPSHGSTSVNTSTGAITYTPSLNYNGGDNFTYQICDSSSACDTATVSVTILAVNDPPVAIDDAANVAEDSSTPIAVASNDSDPDGNLDPTTVTVLSGPANGLTQVDPITGVATYTPSPNYNGGDAFTYQICDDLAACATAFVTITVTPVNDPPIANNDSGNTAEDTQVWIDVPANDTDIDNNLDLTSVTVITSPSHGSTSVNAITGAASYIPGLNYYGSDSFSYRICDTSNACDTAGVAITIAPVNDPPVTIADTANTTEDTAQAINVLANDSDPEGNLDPTSVSVTSLPTNGSATTNSTTGVITYTPDPNFHGLDTFIYQVCDTSAACNTAPVSMTVTSVNDLPIAVDDSHVIFQDRVLSVTPPGVLGNDSDADGDPLTALLVSSTMQGSLAFHIDGSFIYTPTAGYVGADTFTYLALDGTGQSNLATVSINVLDTTKPVVNWVAPVGNRGTFDGGAGLVGLEVTASDNHHVAYVRFYSSNGVIAVISTPPYAAQVDTRTLSYDYNGVLAKAYDDAGNASDPQYIYLFGYKDRYFVMLPVLTR